MDTEAMRLLLTDFASRFQLESCSEITEFIMELIIVEKNG